MWPNPICLDDVLVAIRQRSNQTPANVRISELDGMVELIEHLTKADYRTPAILYGFLKSEIKRLGS